MGTTSPQRAMSSQGGWMKGYGVPATSSSVEPAARSQKTLHWRRYLGGPFLASGVAGLVGVLVLVGWALGYEPLKRVLPGFTAMNPTTALSFILAGVALWVLSVPPQERRAGASLVAQACSACITLVGALKLADVLFGWTIGIDEMFFRTALAGDGSEPLNRMALNTAFNLIFLGLALCCMDRPLGGKLWVTEHLALVAVSTTLLALVGYLYGMRSFYSIGVFTPMALHTAATFLALLCGILSARPDRGLMATVTSQSAGGLLARRLLPAAIGVPIVLGWLRLEGERAGLYNTTMGVALIVVATVAIFAGLVWWNAAMLHQADTRLQMIHTQLESRVSELTALSELSNMAQVCRTAEEAYEVIAAALSALFPGASGGVAVLKPSRDLVEMVAIWGAPKSAEVFASEECWALRRGRAYASDGGVPRVRCRHLRGTNTTDSLCVPMLAHGDVLGIFHLELDARATHEADRPLAQTVAGQLALIIANLRLLETLRHQSLRDELTGLFNRRYLEASLAREWERAKRSAQPIGIIMLDLDHYKRFNDTYGHRAGDDLLRAIGRLLQAQVRGVDIACRYGGEEFLLLLPGACAEVTQRRAKEIRIAISTAQVDTQGQMLPPVTGSLGVAAFPEHGMTMETVIEQADRALYAAKQAGRDQVLVAPRS